MGTRAPLPQTPVRTAVDWRVWAPCGSRSDPVLDKQTAKSIFWQQWDKIEHRRILNSTKELLRILLFVKTVSWSCFKMSLCMRWCNCRSGYRWNERMLRVAWKVLKQEGWGIKVRSQRQNGDNRGRWVNRVHLTVLSLRTWMNSSITIKLWRKWMQSPAAAQNGRSSVPRSVSHLFLILLWHACHSFRM